jgi:hypothetical protein
VRADGSWFGGGMMIAMGKGMGLAVLAAVVASSAFGQAAGNKQAPARALLSAAAENGNPGADHVVREIDDPHTGARWLLMRDPKRPGGPGRMVLAAGMEKEGQEERAGASSAASEELSRKVRLPVIRAGDRLIVEENTAVVEAWLEAVALGPAPSGSPLNARLTIGGKVVRVVALGPGRAAFAAEAEGQR